MNIIMKMNQKTKKKKPFFSIFPDIKMLFVVCCCAVSSELYVYWNATCMSNEASHCLFVCFFFKPGFLDWDTLKRIRSRGENIDANLERAESPKTKKSRNKIK
jgi:hypothetical protein